MEAVIITAMVCIYSGVLAVLTQPKVAMQLDAVGLHSAGSRPAPMRPESMSQLSPLTDCDTGFWLQLLVLLTLQ